MYIGSAELQAEYTLDASEFDSPPQIAEGDLVTVWVATVQETVYSPFWGTAQRIDWRIIKLQSQRGSWTARDYSYRAAAAQAAAHPGFGWNYQTVQWVGLIGGSLMALFFLVAVRARWRRPQ